MKITAVDAIRVAARDIVTVMPRIENGFVHPMAGGGLGTRLRGDIRKRSDVWVRRRAA